jgi:hypothetical protein
MKPLYSLPFMLLYQTQLFIELKVLSYNNVKQVLHFSGNYINPELLIPGVEMKSLLDKKFPQNL